MRPARLSSSKTQRPFNRAAVWLMTAGLLLAGCGERRDAQVPPATPTPRPAPSTTIVQKPQPELAQMFSAAGPVISSVKTSAELARVKPGNNVTLSPQSNGLKITATSHRPWVFLPGFRSGRAVLELVLHSPADTTLQLFYRLPGQRSFRETQPLKQKTKAGRNVIYVELPALASNITLRLDPGSVAGEYLLESFEAKAVSAAVR